MYMGDNGELVALLLVIVLVLILTFGWRYFRWTGNEVGVALTKSSPRTEKDWDLITKSAEKNAEGAKYGISRFAASVTVSIGLILLWIGYALVRERVEILAAIGALMLGTFVTALFAPPLLSSIRSGVCPVDPKKMFSPLVIHLAVYFLFFPAIALEAYWFFMARSESAISFGEVTSLLIFAYLIGFIGLWRSLRKR